MGVGVEPGTRLERGCGGWGSGDLIPELDASGGGGGLYAER